MAVAATPESQITSAQDVICVSTPQRGRDPQTNATARARSRSKCQPVHAWHRHHLICLVLDGCSYYCYYGIIPALLRYTYFNTDRSFFFDPMVQISYDLAIVHLVV